MATSPNSPTATWTRRRILGWGGAGAAGSFVAYMTWPSHQTAPATTAKPPTLPTASSPTAATALAQAMSREDFLPHLHSSFRLEATADCTLVEVSAAQKHLGPVGEFSSFTLLFKAPVGFTAQSKIHQLLHAQMGQLDLFLSPVGRAQEHLEAVFSQRV